MKIQSVKAWPLIPKYASEPSLIIGYNYDKTGALGSMG